MALTLAASGGKQAKGGAPRSLVQATKDNPMTFAFTHIPSPVGTLKLVAGPAGLAAILWENDREDRVRLGDMIEQPDHPVLAETRRQLEEYFAGKRTRFDLPLDFRGTAFQKSVWAALLTIPAGETRSYTEIAAQVGRPTATRAVGAANGKNPISIVAPCHRVIGSDGSLTGFAGGLEGKRYLLELEQAPRAPAEAGA